ncbi:MAG: alkaline phosphatase [Chitinophagaceae bacterium]
MNNLVRILIPALFLLPFCSPAQQLPTTANAHSHNDYEKSMPFRDAWQAGFGSVEADVFLQNDELFVSHTKSGIQPGRTLRSLYLDPIRQTINTNGGHIYKDSTRSLQLMIDFKTAGAATMAILLEQLKSYPEILSGAGIKITISGNKPDLSTWSSIPSWIWFDGDFGKQYPDELKTRLAMFSANFASYSKWNGKGRMPEKEKKVIDSLVNTAHTNNKKVRFWNAPDILNSWYAYLDQGIDYINTDHIKEISVFFEQMADRVYRNAGSYELYKPLYRNDGTDKPIRNIILLIGDGTGLPQWYAGYTANHAKLNVFNMRYTGLSKTSSYDNYITDSAPGATAFSSGKKTNNRAVGVDHTGQKLELLPQILKSRSIKTGVLTSGDLRDATPAAFYAHRSERSDNPGIITDLLNEPIDLIMGACPYSPTDSLFLKVKAQFDFYTSPDDVKDKGRPIFVADPTAAKHMLDGRGDWSRRAFEKSLSILSKNKPGFLLMLEGAQVDHGGHANKLPWAVTELLDFDQVIGRAMEFADSNGETLVIVTADHETGGLTLTGGDYQKGLIQGQFSTGDHTALPVPVFAYGPGSQYFSGVYENVEIFSKILRVMKIKSGGKPR